MTAVQLPAHPRPSVILIDHRGVVLVAPEVAIATPHELAEAARVAAAVLVCRGGCGPAACRGHMPLKPVLGERIIIGRRGTDRAVYRITFTSIAGHIRLEREA